MSDADVLILGGGPAGSAAAIRLAAAGRRVVVLEAAEFPRSRPGETLHPGVEPILDSLGVMPAIRAADFTRHRGIRVQWGGVENLQEYGGAAGETWEGWQMDRAHLDAILLAEAGRRGVEVHCGVPVEAPICAGGRVIGVVTRAGEWRAPWVIDAAGGRHFFARKLGLGLAHMSPPFTARYGYARGILSESDALPSLCAESGGWLWKARLSPGRYTWTHLSVGKVGKPRDWVPNEFAGLQREGPARGADVSWRRSRVLAGPGFFLAGDAAVVLDPAASHGVLRALMSGIMAAHLIASLEADPTQEDELVTYYDDWLGSWISHDTEAMTRLYRQAHLLPA